MALYETFDYLTCLIDVSDDDQVSQAVDLGGRSLVAIITPAALTGTALTFTASRTLNESIANYLEVKNTVGSDVSVTMSTDDYIALNAADFFGVNHIRIKSGAAEGADRTFILVTRAI